MSEKQPTDTNDDLIESEPIVRLFTNPSNVRIMVALADAAGEPLSPGDIANQSNIDRSAWYRNKDDLIDLGLVESAGKVGNSETYRARTETEAYQAFVHLYDSLIEQAAEDE